MTKYFVARNSIVRRIWGKSDTVLFIFAGAAAEFALNKAVDWLYFTGRIPADPLGRLFSTVAYSRRILFSEEHAALQAIDQITAIHKGVEKSRAAQIPEWAYRDVLFMLIDYSIRSFELLERPLTAGEKNEVFNVFYRMGIRMGLTGLPQSYAEWLPMRQAHLQQDLIYSKYTADLYKQYRKHLGTGRFILLKQVQKMLVPDIVNTKLRIGNASWIWPVLYIYKTFRTLKPFAALKNALLPAQYKVQIKEMDMQTS